tara:strand:- start:1522 stop:2955 length:1434 start_codon:yes stop_codon:yes gene_type:complete
MTNLFVVSMTLRAITLCSDFSKAVWSRYFALFLLDRGFLPAEIGMIKAKSLIFKTFFQILIPFLEDSGFFSILLPRDKTSHIISILALILSIPVYLSINSCVLVKDIFMLTIMKSILSSLSAFSSLTESLVVRTVQKHGLVYSMQQFMHLLAWSLAALISGIMMDLLGSTIMLPLTIVPKLIAVVLIGILSVASPLARHQKFDSVVDSSLLSKIKLLVFGDKQILTLIVSTIIWGSCFIVIETITIFQLKQEFGFSHSAIGATAIFTTIGGLPVYYNTKYVVSKIGAEMLIFTGVYSSVFFLLMHSLLSPETIYLCFILCSLRAFSYACIWAGIMEVLLDRIDPDMITSFQSMFNICWFTLGSSSGYAIWTESYTKFGAQKTYIACGICMMLSLKWHCIALNKINTIRLMSLLCILLCCVCLSLFQSSTNLDGFTNVQNQRQDRQIRIYLQNSAKLLLQAANVIPLHNHGHMHIAKN